MSVFSRLNNISVHGTDPPSRVSIFEDGHPKLLPMFVAIVINAAMNIGCTSVS